MASKRFLFVTWDGGGNTAPTYPLVRELVARGHRVALLGQPAQAAAARQFGATFTPLGLPDWLPGKSVEEQRDVSLRENVNHTLNDLTLFNRKGKANYE
jgi:UDP:flavonoid glycosyltransferase YjiC (YdhE family)